MLSRGKIFLMCLAGVIPALPGYAVDYYYTDINNSNVTITAGNSLTVGSGSGNYIHSGEGSGNITLNVASADWFSANVGEIRCGYGPGDNVTGSMYLSVNNTVVASTSILIGTTGTNERGTMTTANGGTTTIKTPLLILGQSRLDWGDLVLGTNSTLTLEGISGNRAKLVLGQCTEAGSSGSWGAWGTANLSAGTASLKLSSLICGQMTVTNQGNSSYKGEGTLTFGSIGTNHLDISGTGIVAVIGYAAGYNPSTGNVTLRNLDTNSAIVSTDNSTAVLMGYKGGSGSSTGTLNLENGTLTIVTAGAGIFGGGGTARLNLNNCTLKAGASSTNWISGLTSATLTNNVVFDTGTNDVVAMSGFSGSGKLVKQGAKGVLALSGSNTYSGGTVVSNGNLLVDGSLTGDVAVKAGGGFGGSGSVSGNVVFDEGASGFFVPGGDALGISGSLTLTGGNTIHLRLPVAPEPKLPLGYYTLATYNTSGSSGGFSGIAVIDSGAAEGVPYIKTKDGVVTMRIMTACTLIIVR